MQLQTKKTLLALAVCLPIVICYFLPVQPNVFTYPLVHANIFHLAANVFALYSFMKYADDKETFVCFIIGGYIASIIAYILYCGDYMVVGASGFIFGIIGIYLMLRYRGLLNKKMYKSPLFINIAILFAVGLIIPSLAGLLHVYALLAGMSIGYLLLSIERFMKNLQQYM